MPSLHYDSGKKVPLSEPQNTQSRPSHPDVRHGQMHCHRRSPEDATTLVQRGKAQLSIKISAKSHLASTLLIHMGEQPELHIVTEEAGGEDKKTRQFRQGGHAI